MRSRARVVLVLVSAVALLAPAVSAQARGATRVVAHCTDLSVKPAHYIFFCADGGAGLHQATYTHWGRWKATGAATYFFNDCKPSCAGATIHRRAATFRLYRLVDTTKYGPLFTRITVSTSKRDYRFRLPTSPL